MHSVCSCKKGKKNAIGMYSSCHNVVSLELTADHRNGNLQNHSSLNSIYFRTSAYRFVAILSCIFELELFVIYLLFTYDLRKYTRSLFSAEGITVCDST